MMLFRRRRPAPPAAPRPDPLAIAVLEYDELGIAPQPGTAAALAIGLRAFGRSGTCTEHRPIATTSLSDPRPNATCERCGQAMILDDGGDWRIA
ncbi:hypothetical protein [Kitasatospora indigofera]|uniref:hypothetical protein n=1 Tax=Kitasatospora indigofera TaxID=67307 RepID=UPI00369CC576